MTVWPKAVMTPRADFKFSLKRSVISLSTSKVHDSVLRKLLFLFFVVNVVASLNQLDGLFIVCASGEWKQTTVAIMRTLKATENWRFPPQLDALF